MRRAATVTLRSQRGFMLVGQQPLATNSRTFSTSADDLLQLFKQAASNKSGDSQQAAPSPAGTAGRGRAQAPSGHWAKQLASQLGGSGQPAARKEENAPRPTKSDARRQALFSPVGTAEENVTPLLRRDGRPERRVRPDLISPNLFDSRFEDDFDEDEYGMRTRREDETDLFSQDTDEGGDDDWETMAAEMTSWGARLQNSLRPHFEVLNKHTKVRRMRRQKYRMFLERVIARRQAKKKSSGEKKDAWQWPKERDLVYNTDLFVPLNLELKGIEEEGEDLHGLLTQQMEMAARAIGHNASWPLEEKRKLMLGMKRFYEQAVRKGPSAHDIFADHRHAMDDDIFVSGGGSTSEE